MTTHREHEPTPPTPQPQTPDEREMIPLQDLAPRQDVKGGASKLLFGQGVESLIDETS
jgi:hypothetical protein